MRGAIRCCADPTAAFANGSFDHQSLARVVLMCKLNGHNILALLEFLVRQVGLRSKLLAFWWLQSTPPLPTVPLFAPSADLPTSVAL
jgi:hypothetical protein